MFSGKIASGVIVVVRTDNQSVLKIHIWLSVTIFGCLGQPDNHYYEPCCIHVCIQMSVYRCLYTDTCIQMSVYICLYTVDKLL